MFKIWHQLCNTAKSIDPNNGRMFSPEPNSINNLPTSLSIELLSQAVTQKSACQTENNLEETKE